MQAEVHERHFLNPVLHHQSAFRAHLHKTWGDHWDVSIGGALFLNTPNDSKAVTRLAVPEYRPHLDFAYKHRGSRLRIDHRLRSEMRFNQGTDATRSELRDQIALTNYRFRYRIQVQFPLILSLTGKVNTEILLNAGQENPQNYLDQHRLFLGISIPIRSNLTADVGYLHSFQQRPNLNYYDRSILSIMIYHRLLSDK